MERQLNKNAQRKKDAKDRINSSQVNKLEEATKWLNSLSKQERDLIKQHYWLSGFSPVTLIAIYEAEHSETNIFAFKRLKDKI